MQKALGNDFRAFSLFNSFDKGKNKESTSFIKDAKKQKPQSK
jgi:hypothetical protein